MLLENLVGPTASLHVLKKRKISWTCLQPLHRLNYPDITTYRLTNTDTINRYVCCRCHHKARPVLEIRFSWWCLRTHNWDINRHMSNPIFALETAEWITISFTVTWGTHHARMQRCESRTWSRYVFYRCNHVKFALVTYQPPHNKNAQPTVTQYGKLHILVRIT